MSLAPLLAATPTVQVHAAAASLALICMAGVSFLAKGTPFHVWVGRIFAGAMLVTAATSFWITGLRAGHYSPIHILSLLTLVTVPFAIWSIRRGERRKHAYAMAGNAVGLLVAGAFTLLPGRVLHAVVFGP